MFESEINIIFNFFEKNPESTVLHKSNELPNIGKDFEMLKFPCENLIVVLIPVYNICLI
jgi:hypothetical protein